SSSVARSLRDASFFYGMVSSLVLALVLLLVFRAVPDATLIAVRQNVLLTFGIGIAFLVIMPLVAIASFLVSVWLGLSLLTLYMLMLFVAFGLTQIVLGWWLLQWWFGRTKQAYELDWRAVVIGVIAITILSLVQVFGWFIIF